MKYLTLKRCLTLIALALVTLSPAYAAMQEPYAMVFFYRSDCPYCHSFAPKLKALAEQKQFHIYVFSLDNQPIPDFPVPIPATPQISQMFFDNPRNITVPATFLINVSSRKFVKVSIGDVTYRELEQSVNRLLSNQHLREAMQSPAPD
ncbi:type-F conjugative transfer system pilin assembly thiol-disulfide isomerase TrbB [Vibrio ouci]|uniref:Type-F conjugative transfer system pilin assembly thiol-disulfide isomerase TrbB n=1 Tax=Vibrio ouci TaxID=2499078 RepID=A0A4Y8W8T3_9VIBR|nr:type-F conjugative transfer system pilin assembly thiol-disulfide isomerase TrbB [Vibrio ouci]TFH89342.1 type-F conjugative transfer system pilin assembly thiol-disulfide isomerase TrbB [Vibrio ouci]